MARYDDGWPAYVPVAERRRKAEREAAKLRKKGHPVAPVTIEGRAIVTTVWGKAWCDNLESYRDYESRLPRGRTYVRNGSVIDLQIEPREVRALVSGSSIYKVTVAIAPVPAAQWRSICTDCAGRIDSLVELLQGRLSKGVMERICRQGAGLFPKPSDIRFSCSCLDFASMCKHVAAVLYGVGARLDRSPELLFRMRAVDENELLAGLDSAMPAATLPRERVLADDDVAALFGLDMTGADGVDGGVGNSLKRRSPVSKVPGTSLPRKQARGRSRVTPAKKPASAVSRSASLPGAGRYAAMASRPKTPAASAKRASRAPARGRSSMTAAASDEAAPRREEPSAAPVRRGRVAGKPTPVHDATSAERAAKVQLATAQDAARSRSSRRARVPDGSSPVVPPITSTHDTAPDLGSGPAPDALMARLDAIAQNLAELPALRAEVRALGERVEQLAAVMTGQSGVGVEAETPSPSERGASSARARRRSRSSGPVSSLGTEISTDPSEAEGGTENPIDRDRDPGDAVPPGVAVRSPARLTGEDKAVLRNLEELPKRRGAVAGADDHVRAWCSSGPLPCPVC